MALLPPGLPFACCFVGEEFQESALSLHLNPNHHWTGAIDGYKPREAHGHPLSSPNIDNTYTPTSSEEAPPAPYIRARCYRYAVPQRICRNKIIGLTPYQYVVGSSPR